MYVSLISECRKEQEIKDTNLNIQTNS